MSQITSNIADHPQFFSAKKQRTRRRVFDLGEHIYSGAPGLSWCTNYWIKRIGNGEQWELYTSREEAISRREYAGTFSPAELREYFDGVGFVLEEQSWLDYGLAYTADIINLEVNHG